MKIYSTGQFILTALFTLKELGQNVSADFLLKTKFQKLPKFHFHVYVNVNVNVKLYVNVKNYFRESFSSY